MLIKKYKYTNVQLPANTEIIPSDNLKIFNWNEFPIEITVLNHNFYFQAFQYIKENNYFVKFQDTIINTDGNIIYGLDKYIGKDYIDISDASYFSIEKPGDIFYITHYYNDTLFYIDGSSTSTIFTVTFYLENGNTFELNSSFNGGNIYLYRLQSDLNPIWGKKITKIEFEINTTNYNYIRFYTNGRINIVPQTFTPSPQLQTIT
ncbi:MAG TPA: hypothetical protein EYP33_03545, partial [Pyrodictium sp.]|nr:hypothetical protein [Pyrodictium sp.]